MGLVDRVKNILLSPKQEWEVIDGEAATVGSLYTGYIIPLAAIGADLPGDRVFGLRDPAAVRRAPGAPPSARPITSAVVTYVADAGRRVRAGPHHRQPRAHVRRDPEPVQALKVATYSYTAAWVCGIFALIPGLRFLTILGLYSLYLLYLGLPVLMKSPKEKALAYTAVVIIVGIIISVVIGVVAGRFIASPTMGGFSPVTPDGEFDSRIQGDALPERRPAFWRRADVLEDGAAAAGWDGGGLDHLHALLPGGPASRATATPTAWRVSSLRGARWCCSSCSWASRSRSFPWAYRPGGCHRPRALRPCGFSPSSPSRSAFRFSCFRRWRRCCSAGTTTPRAGGDPYPLYAASNLGSLVALLSYPVRRRAIAATGEAAGRLG